MSNPLLEKISSLRIAVIGDVMLDHYLWGDTNRISPEAPVPVVAVHKETYTAGGAANVALNLASLGVRTTLCGLIGRDQNGGKLRSVLADRGVDFPDVFEVEGFPTIVKTRVLVRNQQLCRLDVEPPPESYCPRNNGLMGKVPEMIRQADAVILSDYAKGLITQDLVDLILERKRTSGLLVAVDPKPKRVLDYSGAGLMTPNRSEAYELAGMSDPDHGKTFPAAEVGKRIFDRHAPDALVVTLGADGMMIYRSSTDFVQIPTAAREVYDVSGAGDTVVSLLTAALASGLPLEEAAAIANVAAGIVVAKLGTAAISPEELAAALPDHLASSPGKR